MTKMSKWMSDQLQKKTMSDWVESCLEGVYKSARWLGNIGEVKGRNL